MKPLMIMLLRLVLVCAMAFSHPPVQAAPARLSIAQYKHTRWTTDDGAPRSIYALAQGRDGFLWIGAADGLFRFDGVSFEMIRPERQIGDATAVSAVLAARDGSIWIGYTTGGGARFSGGVLRDVGMPEGTSFIQRLRQARDGTIWALTGSSLHPLLHYAHGRWEAVGSNRGLPADHALDLLTASDGAVWATMLHSTMVLRPGERRFVSVPFTPVEQARLAEDPSGAIWASDRNGTRVITGSTRLPYPTPYAPRSGRAFLDRNGDLWGNVSRGGIFRVAAPLTSGEASASTAASKVERFRGTLSSDDVMSIIEDGEGSIWVGTSQGLDRFRRPAVVAETMLADPPLWSSPLVSARDGSIYVGQATGVFRIRPHGSPELVLSGSGEAEAICEGPDDAVWMIMQKRIVRFAAGRAMGTMRKPATRQGIIDCAVDRSGTLFLSAEEGMFQRTGFDWRMIWPWEGEQLDSTKPLLAQRDGSILAFLSHAALRRIDAHRSTDYRLARQDAFRQPNAMTEVPGAVLLGGRFGLARWRGNEVEFLNRRRIPGLEFVTGVATTAAHGTWLMGAASIINVNTMALNRAFDDPRFTPAATVFDFRDGLTGVSNRYARHAVAQGGDGRLWFSTNAGVVWIDPGSLVRNARAPPVAITALEADGRRYRDPSSIALPSGSTRLAIDFTALSLAIPERVRFRYLLEGVDKGWIDPGTLRRASYTNLRPSSYRFRVIAANNDGVWNRKGATLDLTIPPTFTQSNWFLLLCAGLAALLLWTAYKMRTRQLTARVRERLETQLAERERIARELHDTLLQGFQGLVLRFQSVANRMPPGQPLRTSMDQALDRAESVLTEGRDRVSSLRFAGDADLADSLARVAAELDPDGTTRATITTEGRSRDLYPIVREELLRIGGEAIGNAYRHAHAKLIEVALHYGENGFELGVRDDGVGLDQDVIATGRRTGHFGLVGMRERAERAGGRLSFASRAGGGTEVRISIPGRLAYRGHRPWWGLRLPEQSEVKEIG